MVVVPACFALILLLLYAALRSVRDAAIVFTGVPLALVGGAIALLLRGMPFLISAALLTLFVLPTLLAPFAWRAPQP